MCTSVACAAFSSSTTRSFGSTFEPAPQVICGLDEDGSATSCKLFRHKVLAPLRARGLLSQGRIELLLSWRRSGFSVHNRVYLPPPAPLHARLARGPLPAQGRA